MDEHDDRLGETSDEAWEVVDHSEADAIQVPDNLQKFDEFGAPIRPVVKVRDGVQDSEQHRGRRA